MKLAPPERRLPAGVTATAFIVAGAAAGLCVARFTGGRTFPTPRVVDALIAIALGVGATTTVVFSLLLLVVQWAGNALTPRLPLFRHDPAVWRTFAYLMAVFVFCLTAMLNVGNRGTTSAAVPAFALLLAIGAALALRNLQIKAFNSMQLAPVLHTVTENGRKALETLRPDPHAATAAGPDGQGVDVRWPHPPAAFHAVDADRMIRMATAADAVIEMRTAVGSRLETDSVIARVHGGPIPADAVVGALTTGPERIFRQDPLFALRLLADISLRGLSGLNAPATAVQALNHIDDLLRLAAQVTHDQGQLTDGTGRIRLTVPLPSWDDYLRTALDDVINAAEHSPMTLRRLRELLDRLAAETTGPDHDTVGSRLHRVQTALAALEDR
ncbi:DUF2254 family protein [Catellatospora tritici]|uniref:DUF2254 family protein n=1 Tax=Catellatospora tritici TaxID=2851566 RepID=UPI001C2DBDE9|nr:DUF2254 family protein [Catellatospora tritici]MBV1850557.1 DUF2254 domain-containing protein [Catellatospora tritici]